MKFVILTKKRIMKVIITKDNKTIIYVYFIVPIIENKYFIFKRTPHFDLFKGYVIMLINDLNMNSRIKI